MVAQISWLHFVSLFLNSQFLGTYNHFGSNWFEISALMCSLPLFPGLPFSFVIDLGSTFTSPNDFFVTLLLTLWHIVLTTYADSLLQHRPIILASHTHVPYYSSSDGESKSHKQAFNRRGRRPTPSPATICQEAYERPAIRQENSSDQGSR